MPEGKLRSTIFTLTRSDALVYETTHFRYGRRGVLLFGAWLVLCAAAALLIPRNWAGEYLSVSSMLLVSIGAVIGAVLALLAVAIWQWHRAARLVQKPHDVTIHEWADRIEWEEEGAIRTFAHAALQVHETETHVFLTADEAILTLPRASFDDDRLDDLLGRIASARMLAQAGPVPLDVPVPEEEVITVSYRAVDPALPKS